MYASLRIIGMITDDMGLVCDTRGEKRNAHGILVGKPKGKRPLGRRRHRLEDNIKKSLKGIR